MSEPTIDEIMVMIAKHGSVTAEPLRDLIVTVVLEAVEAEREACAKLWQKDAERYRFLRDRAWPFEFKGDDPKDADAAIDLARGEK